MAKTKTFRFFSRFPAKRPKSDRTVTVDRLPTKRAKSKSPVVSDDDLDSIPLPEVRLRRIAADPRLRRQNDVRQKVISSERTVQIKFSNDRQRRSDTSNGRLNQSDTSHVRHIRITKNSVDATRDESRFQTF